MRAAFHSPTIRPDLLPLALLVALHAVVLGLMLWSEAGLAAMAGFVLAWGLLNALMLLVLRRPIAAAAVSLALIAVLILLARLKYSTLFMTIDFVDLMIIDADTFTFLLTVFPGLAWTVAGAVAISVVAIAALWWIDPWRMPRHRAALGLAACLAGLVALAAVAPTDARNDFANGDYVSKFARSGVSAVADYARNGLFDAAPSPPSPINAGGSRGAGASGRVIREARADNLLLATSGDCKPAQKSPHIILLFDESAFDARVVPGVRAAEDYPRHFASFDGKERKLLVEGVGGPSWFTEYNVLTGLSVHSYGRFADFVTRIAAGRVELGLAYALRRCGYTTFSHYPFHGAFLSARGFQQSAGIERFVDMKGLGTNTIEGDAFYFDAALRTIAREKAKGPMFLMMYTAINHFPWSYTFNPARQPARRAASDHPEIKEYLRRQAMSIEDYAAFEAALKRDFPDDAFLIVRFGDHLPNFAPPLIEANDEARRARIAARDPLLLTTYYAINAVNFTPRETSAALPVLDAPYLPIVTLEAAGLPLDATFAEQKRILARCSGLFFACNGGAEVRRFNRMLIDAGLIKGL